MSHVSTVDDAAADRHAFRFFHTLRVRWAEVDRQGIVFNGHYLTYFDVAITEYWRAIGVPYPAITDRWGSDLFVVKASVEYHAPAHYDDVLDIGVRVARIGTSSMTFFDLGDDSVSLSLNRVRVGFISDPTSAVCYGFKKQARGAVTTTGARPPVMAGVE